MVQRQRTLGARIRVLARHCGLSTYQLAARVGCSPTYLYRVISGQQSPSWHIVCALAAELEVSLDTLADHGPPLHDLCVRALIADDQDGDQDDKPGES